MEVNVTYDVFVAKLSTFKDFLDQRGAEILVPTNEWELLRFRTGKAVSVVYFNKHKRLNFVGEADTAWKAYKNGTSWRAMPVRKRSKPNAQDYDTIKARDGDACFYCLKPVFQEDATIEHLVSKTHGGPEHISNKFLAHEVCNSEAGYLSAPEKIKVHTTRVVQKHYEDMLKQLKGKIV